MSAITFISIFIQIILLSLRMTWGVLWFSARILTALVMLGSSGLSQLWQSITHQKHSTANGSRVLWPGQRCPPHLNGDVRDYGGLAKIQLLLPTLEAGMVRLGRYYHPSRSTQGAWYTAAAQGSTLLWLEENILHRHVAIIGPSGSGKTSCIMNPWALQLLQSGNSVVVVDVKNELHRTLAPQAKALGYRVWLWNFSQPAESQSWNCLAEIEDQRDIDAVVDSILGRDNPRDPQPFFAARDRRWLRALVAIAHDLDGEEASLQEVRRWVANPEALGDLFRCYPQLVNYQEDLRDLINPPPDSQAAVSSGLLNKLSVFASDPAIQQVTERLDFRLCELDEQPTLLLIGASLGNSQPAKVLSSLMLNRLFSQVYRRYERGVSSNQRSLYFVLDEAGQLGDRVDYGQVLSVARSARVGIVLALQDVTQLGDETQVSGILTNCGTVALLNGCSQASAQYFGSRLGQRQITERNRQKNRHPLQMFPGITEGEQSRQVAVVNERELMHLPEKWQAIVHVREVTEKPFLVSLVQM